MDKETIEYRRRIKAARTRRNEFSSNYEARGYGRKSKIATFPNSTCNFKSRDGIRCAKPHTTANVEYRTMFGIAKGRFCDEHLPLARATMQKGEDKKRARSKRKATYVG